MKVLVLRSGVWPILVWMSEELYRIYCLCGAYWSRGVSVLMVYVLDSRITFRPIEEYHIKHHRKIIIIFSHQTPVYQC